MITVGVLGPLEVTVGGAPADAGGPRQRCVLARLIAAHGRVVSADRLIDDLYADEAPPRALAAVQVYVSQLRRVLEPGRAARAPARALITSPPGYALRLDLAAVDAWAFEETVHQAAGLDDPAAVHGRLKTALACWRGAAFQEFGGLPWADLEAARLNELRLMATERLAAAALGLRRAAEVVPGLDALTAEHPLREEAWRLLALALYQSGRQGDALAALRRARAKLAAELGVDPGPALRELEDSILAQAPHLSPPAARPQRGQAAAIPAPPHGDQPAVLAAPFFGRDAELNQVRHAALGAWAGQVRVVLVTGEAGAGKTALADQVCQQLTADGWTVATGRCPEHDGAPPAWAWAEALRQLARAVPPAEPQPLAVLLTDTPQQDSDVAAARFRLHQVVAGYLDAASRAAPLLILLEDVHRADEETLAILTVTAAHLTAARIMLVATYRPAETSDQLASCLAGLATHEPARITLAGLDAGAAAELIRATCTRPADDATVIAITQRTAGNPFFLRETARLYDSEGALAASTEVPAGVRDVLQRRIARLPAAAQTILRQAAVIGAQTDADVLGDLTGVQENQLLDAIDAGLLTGLVTEPAPGQIRFAHALVRDTLYDGLSRLRRTRLHARAAAAIERHHPGEVAALAHHYTQAGTDPVKATRYCSLAAEQAEQRFAYHEAARLWEQAIDCLDQVSDAQVRNRLELVLSLAHTLPLTGQLARARSLRKDAVRAALPLDDPALLARVITVFDVPRLMLWDEYGKIDHELVSTVEETLARLPPGDHPLRCRLLTTLAVELETAESERGYQASAQAVEMARRLGDSATLTMAICGRWMQTFRHDGLEERLSLGTELLALPDKRATTEATAYLGLMAASCGTADFAAADQYAADAARLARRYDFSPVTLVINEYHAMRTAVDGDWAGAEELYQQVAVQIDRLGLPDHAAGVRILSRSSLLIMQGRAAQIAAELDGYTGIAAVLEELFALGIAAAGRVAEARRTAADPLPLRRDRLWLFLTSVRGLLAVAIDDRKRAASAYQDLLPFAGRLAGADTLLITLGPVAQILGDLARYLDLPGAEAHYKLALEIADKAKVKHWRAAALSRLTQPSV